MQLSKEELMKEELSTDINKYRIYSSVEEQEIKADKIRKERNPYRSIILENIGYEYLSQDIGFRINDLEELPKDIVKSRLLKLNSEHIREEDRNFLLECFSGEYDAISRISERTGISRTTLSSRKSRPVKRLQEKFQVE